LPAGGLARDTGSANTKSSWRATRSQDSNECAQGCAQHRLVLNATADVIFANDHEPPHFIRRGTRPATTSCSPTRYSQGRLKNAEKQLATVSRGTEKPACWADQTGKPEYIFDIALKSRSLVIRDNALPHRVVEQSALPLKGLVFGAELGQQDFRAQTRALFDWSEGEGCRFFVRVFDLTAAHEKDIYKRQLRTVGEHFYYYEELTRPWGDERDAAAH